MKITSICFAVSDTPYYWDDPGILESIELHFPGLFLGYIGCYIRYDLKGKTVTRYVNLGKSELIGMIADLRESRGKG